MEYIFTYEDDIPDGYGFRLFGIEHIAWLAVILTAAVCLVLLKGYDKEKLLRFIGDFLLFLIIFRIAVLSLMGKMSVYELPLHMCSITCFLCFIHSRTNGNILGQIIYEVGLPGTLFALIFPNWSRYPAFNFISVQSFLFHGGIVIYVILCLTEKRIIPRLCGVWYSVIFITVMTVPIYIFDRKFDVNYFFVLRPSAGSPLEWFADIMGNPGYLIGYALLVVLVLFAMYGLGLSARLLSNKRGSV